MLNAHLTCEPQATHHEDFVSDRRRGFLREKLLFRQEFTAAGRGRRVPGRPVSPFVFHWQSESSLPQ